MPTLPSGATTHDQNEPGATDREGIPCIPQISSTIVASPSIGAVSTLCRDAIGVIYSQSRQGYLFKGVSICEVYLIPKPFVKKPVVVLFYRYPYLPPTPLGQDMTQGLTGLNSKFSFFYISCQTKAEDQSALEEE